MATASTYRITQIKSTIGESPRHRATLRTLGLRGIRTSSVRSESAELPGMLRLVEHLVRVEPVTGKES